MGGSRNAFVFHASACFLKLLPMKRKERGEWERAFRWPSLKCSPPVSDVIYYLKRSGMFRKTERRLKKDKMKVFIRTAFFVRSFRSKQEISQSGRGNKAWKHNWWVCSQCLCVCVLYIQLKNIILQCYSAFGKFYLYLDIYMSGMTWKEWLKRGTIISI